MKYSLKPRFIVLKQRFPACDAYQVHLRGESESRSRDKFILDGGVVSPHAV